MNNLNKYSLLFLTVIFFACENKAKPSKVNKSGQEIPANNTTIIKNENQIKTFLLNNSSEKFYVKIYVGNCDKSYCKGKGNIEIYDKSTNNLIQSLTSDDLFTELDEFQKPTERNNKLYDGQSVIFFGDYNFDGNEDLAIRNGNLSSYYGPSYDIYLFHKNTFVSNQELTDLVSSNLGMFQIDTKRKRIKTFNKSGCCWHIMTEYIYDKKPIKVYEFEEEITSTNVINITERKFNGNKWKEKKYSKPYK